MRANLSSLRVFDDDGLGVPACAIERAGFFLIGHWYHKGHAHRHFANGMKPT
jgi:hypothetical protein